MHRPALLQCHGADKTVMFDSPAKTPVYLLLLAAPSSSKAMLENRFPAIVNVKPGARLTEPVCRPSQNDNWIARP